MNFLVTRRRMVLAAACATAADFGWATSRPTRQWILGTWKSDRERSVESFYFQGQRLSEQQRARFAEIFGHVEYRITGSHFAAFEQGREVKSRYTIASETDSSITLNFARGSMLPPLTLYRENEDWLFIKVDKNFEYFRRSAA